MLRNIYIYVFFVNSESALLVAFAKYTSSLYFIAIVLKTTIFSTL